MNLSEVAKELHNCNKKICLIYAFNGVGETRLSMKFKDLVNDTASINDDGDENELHLIFM